MSGSYVRSKDTKPELDLRRRLWRRGLRYRLHRKGLPGKPDITFVREKLVVFVNGCFWHMHGCKRSGMPKTNVDYWSKKLQGNKARDLENSKKLTELGYSVMTIWECELKEDPGRCVEEVIGRLHFARLRLQAPQTKRSSHSRCESQTA
ncbi:MAG: very short patch repair endonuclease [Rhodospirillales bacterium]|nr:very short patch repair endonuclease [Rhodospirillales bacterium]